MDRSHDRNRTCDFRIRSNPRLHHRRTFKLMLYFLTQPNRFVLLPARDQAASLETRPWFLQREKLRQTLELQSPMRAERTYGRVQLSVARLPFPSTADNRCVLDGAGPRPTSPRGLWSSQTARQ